MCGRYTNTGVDAGRLAARFGVLSSGVPEESLGRFNVCPTETMFVVASGPDAERFASAATWGLESPWKKGPIPLNARSESVAAKPMFTKLVASYRGRCLVVADGWFEWLRPEAKGAPKTPFHYRVDGGEPFAFAGLWDGATACILTTSANAVCRPVHDRMPVVLAGPEEEAGWLSASVDTEGAVDLLLPLADDRVSARPANPAVNKAGVEGPELLDPPVGAAENAPTLFS